MKLLKILSMVTLNLAFSYASYADKTSELSTQEKNLMQASFNQSKEALGLKQARRFQIHAQNSKNLVSFIDKTLANSLPHAYKNQVVRYRNSILTASAQNQLDPFFVLAVIQQESRFNPLAKGRFGEIGLMQIKPSTAQWIVAKNKLNLKSNAEALKLGDTNIAIGVAYLSFLKSKFKDKTKIFTAAYNMGQLNMKRSLASNNKVPNYQYATAVLKRYYKFYQQLEQFNTTVIAAL